MIAGPATTQQQPKRSSCLLEACVTLDFGLAIGDGVVMEAPVVKHPCNDNRTS